MIERKQPCDVCGKKTWSPRNEMGDVICGVCRSVITNIRKRLEGISGADIDWVLEKLETNEDNEDNDD